MLRHFDPLFLGQSPQTVPVIGIESMVKLYIISQLEWPAKVFNVVQLVAHAVFGAVDWSLVPP